MIRELNPFVRFVGSVKVGEANTRDCVGRENRIFYFTSGEANLIIGGKRYPVSKNAFAYVPSYTEYRFELDDDADVALIAINFDVTARDGGSELHERPMELSRWNGVREGGEELPEEFAAPIVIRDAEGAYNDFMKLYKIFFEREPYYSDFASVYMKKILLFALTRSGSDHTPDPVESILKYIKENFRERIRNTDLAKHFGYHPNHLNRVMKAYTGMTLRGCLIFYRVSAAKELLASTDIPITDISESCGFSTPSYFSEMFLRCEGINPREYRKKMRSIII